MRKRERKRELAGLLLLVVGATGIYLSVERSAPTYIYLTAKRDISPGELVSSTDFSSAPFSLGRSAPQYISGDAKFNGRRSLRKIDSGELVPRNAITMEAAIEKRQLITFTIPAVRVSKNVNRNSVIDIYFFGSNEVGGGVADESKPTVEKVFERVRIAAIERGSSQFDGDVSISILIESEKVLEFMTELSHSAVYVSERFDDVE